MKSLSQFVLLLSLPSGCIMFSLLNTMYVYVLAEHCFGLRKWLLTDDDDDNDDDLPETKNNMMLTWKETRTYMQLKQSEVWTK